VSVRAVRRRRSRTSIAVRIRAFWVIAVLIAVTCAAVAVAFVEAPQLRVRAATATVPAGGPVRVSDVVAAARVAPDANLWLLDTHAIRARIEAIPYVLDARVHRSQFPQPAIAFDVTLRRPTGCVKTTAGTVTIDATARVLQNGCADATVPLVEAGAEPAPPPGGVLTTPDIDRLLADAKAIGDRVPVRIVRRDRFGGLEATDTDGVILRFGNDEDLASKLALVEPIRRSIASAKKLRAIDLRAPDTPVVEFP
jgi:cell division septal protein FtsQ